jgi:hypothetical protein
MADQDDLRFSGSPPPNSLPSQAASPTSGAVSPSSSLYGGTPKQGKKTKKKKKKKKRGMLVPFLASMGRSISLLGANSSQQTGSKNLSSMDPSTAATPATPAPPMTAEPGQLPSPHIFDIVPPLHALLSRLLVPSPHGGAAASGTQTATASQTSPSNNNNAMGSSSGYDLAMTHSNEYLEVQHLDAATDAIRIRIQKARAAVKALPDIDRTVEEQDEEIKELQTRVKRMREMLVNLKSSVAKGAA